jgi:hypothetical protein
MAFLVECVRSFGRDTAYKVARAAGHKFNNSDLSWPDIKAGIEE